MKQIWNDPVWSKVISVGIISIFSLISPWVFGLYKYRGPIIGMVICSTGFIGCLLWYFASNAPSSSESLTLQYLFEHDFPLGSMQRQYDLRVKNTQTNLDVIVPVSIRLYYDFVSHSEFLSAYMPQFHDARLNPADIIANFREQLVDIQKQMHSSVVMGQSQPGLPYSESSELIFSGRVFLYTTNPLNPVQIGDLMKWYQQSGLYLEIRGLDYWTTKKATG
jgi:hypothetical protein